MTTTRDPQHRAEHAEARADRLALARRRAATREREDWRRFAADAADDAEQDRA